jgi:uncharacterized protein YpmS
MHFRDLPQKWKRMILILLGITVALVIVSFLYISQTRIDSCYMG